MLLFILDGHQGSLDERILGTFAFLSWTLLTGMAPILLLSSLQSPPGLQPTHDSLQLILTFLRRGS